MNDWRDQAACLNVSEPDASAFFPWDEGITEHDVDRVKNKYCKVCPVQKECLELALETESQGVWGGISISHRNFDRIYYLWKENQPITVEDEEDAW